MRDKREERKTMALGRQPAMRRRPEDGRNTAPIRSTQPRPDGVSPETEENAEWIVGRNAVDEALKAERPLDRVLIARGERDGRLGYLAARCREIGVPVKEVDSRKLLELCGPHHQGIAAAAACRAYATLEELFDRAERSGRPPLFVVCDGLEDPHNLGAILRTAEAAGAHGVILPRRRSVGLTPAVYKASAGAVEYMPVARVANLTDTLRELKQRGVWIYGLDMDGEPWNRTDLTGPAALVVGSEGNGISRLVRETCDFVVSLPQFGKVNSLNASVACGILLYEVVRQRQGG